MPTNILYHENEHLSSTGSYVDEKINKKQIKILAYLPKKRRIAAEGCRRIEISSDSVHSFSADLICRISYS